MSPDPFHTSLHTQFKRIEIYDIHSSLLKIRYLNKHNITTEMIYILVSMVIYHIRQLYFTMQI